MSFLPAPGAPAPGNGPYGAPQAFPPHPAPAPPNAFAFPDPRWHNFQALRWTTLGLAIVALLLLIAGLFAAVASRDFGLAVGAFLVILLLLFAALGTAIAMWASLSGAQRAFGDAITHAGYAGVDARRLYAGRPVPTPYGFWLRSRRERRPDGTWLIVEPVPGGPNGPAPAAPARSDRTARVFRRRGGLRHAGQMAEASTAPGSGERDAGEAPGAADGAGEARRRETGAIAAEVIGLLMQVPLVWLGALFILDEDIELLAIWCLIGSLYLFATVLALNLAVRVRRLQGNTGTRRFLAHPVMRIVASVLTFSSSTVGVAAAIELLVLRDDPDWSDAIKLFAVWAMLVAWCLFHWGWARMYYSRYHRATGDPGLEFPRTPEPELIDFVYFAFTNATAFSVSDVMVTTPRMRWTVIWHTSLSFFFNALIIVLAVNTITGL